MAVKTLNTEEQEVLKACINNAESYDEDGGFCIDELHLDMSVQQLRGYLSQLVQKGYIEKEDECYFDFRVIREA